jgi:ketosteroid isomerase-like protein
MRGSGAAAPTVPVKLRAVDGFPVAPPRAPADDAGMKIMPAIVLLAAFAGDAAAQSIPASRAADAALIKKEIEIICQAFVDKDRKTLEATHGKNWRGFTPWSDHVIRGLDGYMNEATFDPNTPKGQGMVGYRISDFDVVFYGDTAVASFVLDVDSVRGGRKSTQKLTILDVFQKEPHRWVQVASNTSLHAEAMTQQMSALRPLGDDEKMDLLAAREAVWRAWFGGDTAQLTKLLPPDLITIEPAGAFGNLKTNLDGARGFAAGGGKLTRLVFPKTEFQAYGATVILYTTYEMDLVSGGKASTQKGAATEVFVRQPDGRWVNSGWQLGPSTR